MAPIRTAPLLPTARQRRWSLAAAIASVTVFGVSIGQSTPLLSLLLEARGTDATVNGLNAAAVFSGVIVEPAAGAAWRPGARPAQLPAAVLWAGDRAVSALKLFDSLARLVRAARVFRMLGASIFTSGEAWINLLAGDVGRGRIVGSTPRRCRPASVSAHCCWRSPASQGGRRSSSTARSWRAPLAAVRRWRSFTRAFGRERWRNPFTMLVRRR